MTEIGYALSSEEHKPNDLVRYARRAEEVGFTFALISDHYHPWVSEQGHSPFVWSVIGGISQVTEKLRLGTGVTCPTTRINPAIIAQAAATAASMMPGRFFLGVGTGENLNEHILGDRWPPHTIRLAMLEEAVELIRTLWQGGTTSWWGEFYTVEDARIFTLPSELPPIMVAASGPTTLEAAGNFGDGLIGLAPNKEDVERFEKAGGAGKPKYGQTAVCWAESEVEGENIAARVWPTSGLKGEMSQELRTVAHFEQAAKMLDKEDIVENMVCGPDAQKHVEQIQKMIDAGYDHVYIHQIGPDQEGFFRFYEKEVLPAFR
ncbi:MAG: TIGR03557 family F420-dependent LLM class oxidoreductase [Anaerolineae bacterium]|nr:TIGR03557 family F420-dependent LLM class oxidoreductase [Anaerolineae bacterium]